MTPHAPWTKNWIRKPPSASSGIDTPSAPLQSGIISAPSTHEARIVIRRPKRCESPPSSVPPMIAPMFAMTAIVETMRGREAVLLGQERRKEVLRAVRHEVERRHQQDRVDEEHRAGAGTRPTGCRRDGPGGAARPRFPRRRLLDARADVEHQERRQRAEHEHAAPADALEQEAEHQRRDQVAGRVALLQDARRDAARLGRQRLERERRADAPLAAHRDAVQRAQHDEHA